MFNCSLIHIIIRASLGVLVYTISDSIALAQITNNTPPPVMTFVVHKREISRNSEFAGKIEAFEKVNIVARVQGTLGPRQFVDGQAVKAGQIIFIIEPYIYQFAVEKQKAVVTALDAALKNAKVQLDRTRILASNNAVAKSELDRILAEEQSAEAKLQEAKVILDEALLQLSYTKITSPIDGRIGRAIFTPGNLVSPQSGTLATIVSDKLVRVLFPVSKKELLESFKRHENAQNMTVNLVLSDGSVIKNGGKIDFMDVSVNPATDSILIRATIENKNLPLFDGEVVHVSVEKSEHTDVIMIPHRSVAIDKNGAYCLIVNQDNILEQRTIKLGQKKQDLIEVEEGINDGDQVVVSGIQKLKPGSLVDPKPAKE